QLLHLKQGISASGARYTDGIYVFFTDCQWVTLLCAAPGKISTLWIL
ncbi:hypothetical protein ACUODJ_48850, partial [Escherichia sp. HC-CC]